MLCFHSESKANSQVEQCRQFPRARCVASCSTCFPVFTHVGGGAVLPTLDTEYCVYIACPAYQNVEYAGECKNTLEYIGVQDCARMAFVVIRDQVHSSEPRQW